MKEYSHRRVEVTTRHCHDVNYKYIWKCTTCSALAKRRACGSCWVELVQIKPAPRNAPLSDYQLFLKRHFKSIRNSHRKLSHQDIMTSWGAAYKARTTKGAESEELCTCMGVTYDSRNLDSVTEGLEHLDLRAPDHSCTVSP